MEFRTSKPLTGRFFHSGLTHLNRRPGAAWRKGQGRSTPIAGRLGPDAGGSPRYATARFSSMALAPQPRWALLPNRRLIDLPSAKSKNKRRKLVEIPENLAAWLTPQAQTEGSIMPRAKVRVAMANAVEKAGTEWPHNCLRHSFCSHAVALHGLTWTSLQADH
jgi:hypothetical protein